MSVSAPVRTVVGMTRISSLYRLLVLVVAVSLGAPAALAVGAPDRPAQGPSEAVTHRRDHVPGPLAKQQASRRATALELVRKGGAVEGEDGVVQLASDKYVQTTLSGVDQVFTVLAEFGDTAVRRLGTAPGPRHNELVEPDRTQDNATIWAPDFNVAYYNNLYFGPTESLADFYTEQSSGNYTVAGAVSDWVQVPSNASFYGDNSVEDVSGADQFVVDAIDAWFEAQVAAGKSTATIASELAQFDIWDRYDSDHDGDFDEPDGYLDHPQFVHAGEGEEVGGGAQGDDAIWSHFGYINFEGYRVSGPVVDGTPVLLGGKEIGNTGIWLAEHAVVPENTGLGVLAHEYAHDLGLPDLYNYVGQGYNGVGFWSLMSLGSYLSETDGLGTGPGYMGPWEKLQLGWLDYAVVDEGEGGDFTLSPAALQITGQEQAVIVDVPDEGVPLVHATPPSGTTAWWTGGANDRNSTLTRPLDLRGVSRPVLTAKVWHDIEAGYDYLYPEYSRDGGTTWLAAGARIDGSSRGRWVTVRYALPSESLLFRFRYETDPGVILAGAFIDDITVSSGRTTIFADDVESGDAGWVAVDFTRSDGSEERIGDRFYLLEHRTYVGADERLRTGPYVFGRLYSQMNWVQHFAYPDGLLVWMADETYEANETVVHPGHGLVLPVDARPAPIVRSDGRVLANHVQIWDAVFGLHGTPSQTFLGETLVGNGPNATPQPMDTTVAPSVALPSFDDTRPDRYWSAQNPYGSTLVAGHGVVATVNSQVSGGTLVVSVNNPPES